MSRCSSLSDAKWPAMKFVSTELAGAWIIEPEPVNDGRGFFARTFCAREFKERGMEAR